jgi:hypothetical protein
VAALRHSIVVIIGAVSLALPALSSAQEASPGAAAPDSAARLSYVDGAVSVLAPGEQQWSKAFLNRPLSAGDQLWSDAGSRAEVELGGVIVRVSASSEISMLDFSAQSLQLGVGVGTVDVALHYAGSNQSFEIDTPEVAMSLQRDGDYRINVDLDGTTTVLVHSGATHLSNRSGEGISLRDGQGVVFAADGTLDVADAHQTDNFDHWCAQRDAQWQQENAQAAHVPNDVPGAEQLNDNGQWTNQPDSGDVWFPNQVPPGWAPYQLGRWAWVPPWGWTWIDRAAWGFAPFHYGRWANFNGRWGWIPPSSHGHSNFAAALIVAPASVTSTAPKSELAARGNAPPPNIAHRPMIATRNPVLALAAATSLPHVVLAAPPPRRSANTYEPIPSPIGPTIYARDVRPAETAVSAAAVTPRENVARTPSARTSSLPSGPPASTPNFTRLPQPIAVAPAVARAPAPAPAQPAVHASAPKPAHASAPAPRAAMRSAN